jgi:hypothetical protein
MRTGSPDSSLTNSQTTNAANLSWSGGILVSNNRLGTVASRIAYRLHCLRRDWVLSDAMRRMVDCMVCLPYVSA